MADSDAIIGQSVSHYRIIEKLGGGGMGVVYKAEDTRLHRFVALKFLPDNVAKDPQVLVRFQREARAVASLNHPHIVTLYSVEEADGVPFLTMEYVPGESLDHRIPPDGLPIPQIIQIARALADALVAAHEKGIVHRDLKPANIMVTDEGRVKILDFGLAKETGGAKPDDATVDHHTQLGSVVGTPAYMSPEQVLGCEVDARTDIFSVGLVLHEMATGRRAFQGKTSAELVSAVLRDIPPLVNEVRPELPAELARVIRRCLEKDPPHRWQTARDITNELRDLEQSRRQAAAPIPVQLGPSVAVMPFQNLSPDPENEYFSDGLAEEILNALSQVEGLTVAARASSFYFKGKPTEMSEIANRLRVANVLQGSVRRAGNRVRVTVQLVDLKNGFQLWSERYDRQMEDIFEIQDEIARAIAERFKVTFGSSARRSTTNVEAYELYLKGRHLWHQRSPTTLRAAIKSFERAIQIDPEYALAYSGLADSYGILQFYGWMPPEEGRKPAHDAMMQAVKLAPELWEVNFSRGFYSIYFERKWQDAAPHFEKALQINPRSSLAHVYYGLFLLTAGRSDEAVPHGVQACELDPLSPVIYCIASAMFLNTVGCEEAERRASNALEMQPDYIFALWVRSLALSGLGRHEEAVAAMERAIMLSRAPIFTGILGLIYARAGRPGDARRLLREIEDRGSRGEYIPSFSKVAICVGLGDLVEIRTSLAEVISAATSPVPIRIICGKYLETYRSDPEIRRLHLELFGW
jgi:serine/threonine protein kinase/Tfp pilus assembly protein PilF